MTTLTSSFKKITASLLGHSKPNPSWFGNGANPTPLPATWTDANWLYSRFHFNFAEWSDGASNFGVLRVLNDDLVQPSRGFGTHPHANMEIATYVVDGELTHQDSMGSKETLGRGSVQFMSAASGVRHSEHNNHPELPCRFIQMWVVPRARGGKPRYGGFDAAKNGGAAARLNQWQWLVADVENAEQKAAIQLQQDVNIHVTELDSAAPKPGLAFELKADRQLYVLCIEGAVDIVDGLAKPQALVRHEAMAIRGPATLAFAPTAASSDDDAAAAAAKPYAHLLIVEMAKTPESKDEL